VDEEVRNANQVIRERGSFRSYAYEMTPLMVNGVLYATTSLGQIAAIDPISGETLWSYDPVLYVDGRPARCAWLHDSWAGLLDRWCTGATILCRGPHFPDVD
jgi:hypothetical protein